MLSELQEPKGGYHAMRLGSWTWLVLAALLWAGPQAGFTEPIRVLAAENFYGDVAQQVGGPRVTVSSVLQNPNQDPHLFQAGASTARAVANANIVILNGAGYDHWMDALLKGSRSDGRAVIRVDALVKFQAGDNPHLWYRLKAMRLLAGRLADVMGQMDPQHRRAYLDRGRAFVHSLRALMREVVLLKTQYGGLPVAATEPVFGYMAAAIGLAMKENGFQTAIMNDVEPSASQLIQFENDLRRHRVKVLIYNRQVTDRRTLRLRHAAQAAGIPSVGVTETMPPGRTYQSWMLEQLHALGEALQSVVHGRSSNGRAAAQPSRQGLARAPRKTRGALRHRDVALAIKHLSA